MKVKLFKAINGKKTHFLGEGYTIKDAVYDGLICGTIKWEDFRDDLITLDDITEYIQTAHQDYVIVISKE